MCGEEIADKGLKYCPDCRTSGYHQKHRAYIAKRRGIVLKLKEKRRKLLSIREVNRIAYEVNSSYGVISHLLNEHELNRKPYDEALEAVKRILK